jgi:hypothetical protein
MANYMFILRPIEKRITTVCPSCARRGEVVSSCSMCAGTGTRKKSIPQYYVQNRPIEIIRVDRDPKKGVLRYWENLSEFFYETTVPSLNKYVPEVPYGIHLCHDTLNSALIECDRINEYLIKANCERFIKQEAR